MPPVSAPSRSHGHSDAVGNAEQHEARSAERLAGGGITLRGTWHHRMAISSSSIPAPPGPVQGGEYQGTWVDAIEEDPRFDRAVPRMLSARAGSLLDPSRSRVRVSTRRVEVRCGESSEVTFGSRRRFGVHSFGTTDEDFSDPQA